MERDYCRHHYYCSAGTDVNVPEDAAAHTDEELVRLSAYLKCIKDHQGIPVATCKCLIGKHPSRNTSAVLKNFRRVLFKYPCHECHKKILKPMLSAIVNDPLYKGNKNKQGSVMQVLQNLYLNRETFDVEIVAECLRILRLFELPEKEIANLIVRKLKLASVTPTVLSHYVNLWCPISDQCRKQILMSLEAHFLGNEKRTDCFQKKLQDVFLECLVVLFFLDTNEFPLVYKTVRYIMIKRKIDSAWEFLNNFTEKVHSTLDWESNYTTALKYLRYFIFYYVEKLSIWNDSACHLRKEYAQIVKRLLDLVQKIHISDSSDLFGAIVDRVLLQNLLPRDLPRDLFEAVAEAFSSKVLEVIVDEDNELSHDQQELQSKYSCSAPNRKQSNNLDDLIESIFERMYKWFGFVHVGDTSAGKSVTLDLLNALIRSARFKISTVSKVFSFNGILTSVYSVVTLYGRETTLKSGIAQIIHTNINYLHYNCEVCNLMRRVYDEMLCILKPIYIVDYSIDDYGTTQLATTLPYVIHDKNELVRQMYPEGFILLAAELQHDRGIESLYLASETLKNTEEPYTNLKRCKSTTSQIELHESIPKDELGTKIFVLDDGTKIETRVAPLVQNCSFFATLLNGCFAEVTQKEIRIRDVSAFQFSFLVDFIASKSKKKFKLDIQTHLDLVILCNKFLLDDLSERVANSLRSHLKPEILPEIYETALTCGCMFLRTICMDFALGAGLDSSSKMMLLESLFESLDSKALADDAKKWMFQKSIYTRELSKNARREEYREEK